MIESTGFLRRSRPCFRALTRALLPTVATALIPLGCASSGATTEGTASQPQVDPVGGYRLFPPDGSESFTGWLHVEGEPGAYRAFAANGRRGGGMEFDAILEGTRLQLVLPTGTPFLTFVIEESGEVRGHTEAAAGPSEQIGGEKVLDLRDDAAMSEPARAYLEEALEIMEANSINRHKIDWDAFRDQAGDLARGARTPEDTYGAIWYAARQLGDNHSLFFPQMPEAGQSGAGTNPDPIVRHLGESVGYVWIPGNLFDSQDEMARKTRLYHERIEAVDQMGVCGWVVDVRGGTGGNMFPMLQGVGPILGEEGTVGFAWQDSIFDVASYRDGALYFDGRPVAEAYRIALEDPYTLVSADPPVAVLTDGITGSSSEAVAIAFRGRPGTRTFGTATAGFSTGNAPHNLSNGAVLALTEGAMADATGRVYGGVIEPDEVVEGEQTRDPDTDAPLRAAMEWLREQEACAR